VAPYRIRRRFQFGILDLMLFTTIAAVVACLCRPVGMKCRALPWLAGEWIGDTGELLLLPDGVYQYNREYGAYWRLSRHAAASVFLLECGTLRFVVRGEPGSERMELLNEDGSVQSQLYQVGRLEGATRDGRPDGIWTLANAPSFAVEYRNGEPVHWYNWIPGPFNLERVNEVRRVRGLQELDDGSTARATAPGEVPPRL
jgi:hypothetical protein